MNMYPFIDKVSDVLNTRNHPLADTQHIFLFKDRVPLIIFASTITYLFMATPPLVLVIVIFTYSCTYQPLLRFLAPYFLILYTS